MEKGKQIRMKQNDQKIFAAKKVSGWLWIVSGKYKWDVLGLLILQITLAAMAVWQALVLRNMINAAVDKNVSGFWNEAVLLVILILVQLAGRAGVRYLSEHSRSGIENGCKKRLFEVLLMKDYAQVTAVHSGEWMNRLTSDTRIVAEGITQILPDVAGMVVRLIGALIAVLVLVNGFSWLIIPGGLVLGALTYLFRNKLKELHKRIQEADGRLRVFMSERLSNLLVVRSFAREQTILQQAEEAMDDHQRARMKRNHFANLCNVGIGLLIQGAFGAAAIFCGYGILTGSMNYGTFVAVLQLITQIRSPITSLSGYLPKYYAMLASAERLMEAEAYAPDISGQRIEQEKIQSFYDECFAGIALEKVGFTYLSNRQEEVAGRSVVFTDLNLRIYKGETIAVTGPSGCGKSTLLKLLMCLYPVDNGERYLVLQQSASDYANEEQKLPLTAEWRGLYAYVPQGNQLMSGTIREVVSFGIKDYSDEDIQHALKVACVEDVIHALPEGLSTQLGERGAGLSEGQMQRLAIARAVLSGHPILLLDEATSSLDEATELELLCNLHSMTDRTVLIVTHRPQALSFCSKEVRMSEDGIAIKEPNHD